jgi:diketogulonate reductase-like aldo/keto reductase
MGFGFKELKRLRHSIEELAEAYNNSVFGLGDSPERENTYIVSKFLDDIEKYYDAVLGFQGSIDRLKVQNQNLTYLHKQEQQAISVIPHIGPAIASLLRRGVTEDQILNLLIHLEKYPSVIDSILASLNQFQNSNRIENGDIV